MRRLQLANPIWHAVMWIVAYMVLVSVGDLVSEQVGIPNSVTAPLLLLLSILLSWYVSRNGWNRYYGLRAVRADDFRRTLLYIPLLVIALIQFTQGFRDDLDLTTVLLIMVLMACVGFIEELVFRGFLFRGILKRRNLTRAIVISGVTFGIGHIVNLARGYSGVEQITQILFAVVIGIVLALIFAVTGAILPLIVFHALFNISGSVTATDSRFEWVMLAATTIISAGYAVYLVLVLRRRGASPEMALSSAGEHPVKESGRSVRCNRRHHTPLFHTRPYELPNSSHREGPGPDRATEETK